MFDVADDAGVVADARYRTARLPLSPALHILAAPSDPNFRQNYLLLAGGPDVTSGRIQALLGPGGETALPQQIKALERQAYRTDRRLLQALLLAAGLAVVWWWPSDPGHALMVAAAVLIVTCPCALSLATPVAMLTAAGTLARHGVLVRNLQGLEALAGVDTLVFDKTGTLTRDGMAVHSVRCAPGLDRDEALALAATLARQSMHPASRAIVAAAPADSTRWSALSLREEAGQGLTAEVHDASGSAAPRWLRLGSARHAGVPTQDGGEALQVVLSGQGSDGQFTELARFDVIEDVRPEAAEVVRALQQAGVSVQILSGDRLGAVQRVATQAGISQAQGERTPQDKLVALQGLQAQGRHVAMVGDGLNDGPVLAGANVSFAFGRSVPLAQSRADFVVLGGSLSLVAQAVLLARQTLRVVRQNLWWAAGYNALCVPLALVGWMPAWLAGLGMALSSLLVVLNAARLSRALPGAQASGPYMPEQVKGPAPMTTASQSSLDPV